MSEEEIKNKIQTLQFSEIVQKGYKIMSNVEFDSIVNGVLQLQQENSQLKERIEKAIEYIENEYYSKNTIDINSIAYTTNKFLKVRELLKGDKE